VRNAPEGEEKMTNGKESLADQAYRLLKKDIITCEFPPGEQIAQATLTERYEIGLTPIREALQRLALEGFVQSIPRLGYIVTPITFSDVHEIYELRMIAETAAVRLAALRSPKEELKKLIDRSDFSYVYQDIESYKVFLGQNRDFHIAIARLSGNQRLVDLISNLLDELTRLFHLGLGIRDSAAEMHDAHSALAQAILERNPDRAEQIVRNEIEMSQNRVLEALTKKNAPRNSGLYI
jgi:DNA-binding GntR family transcriptional regulator